MQCTLVGIARLLECYSYCRSSLPCSSSAYFYLDGIETNSKFSLTVWYNEHPENRVSFCQAPEILDKSILLSLTKLAYSSARPSGVGGGGFGGGYSGFQVTGMIEGFWGVRNFRVRRFFGVENFGKYFF